MADQLIETPHGHKIPVPGIAYLAGPESWLGLRIRPDRPFVRHRLRHGTRVSVLEAQREGDTIWFYVRNGRRQGWVSWLFIDEEVPGNAT